MGFVVIQGRGWGKWGSDEGSQKVQPSSYTQCQGCNVSLLFTCCHRLRLFVTPWTVARQAPLSVGFSRQEYWSGLPFPPPGDLPDPGIEPVSPALAGRFSTTECVLSCLLCPTFCGPVDCSPPGSSVHGIFKATVLEWVAISSSRGSSRPRDRSRVSYVPCIGRRILYC